MRTMIAVAGLALGSLALGPVAATEPADAKPKVRAKAKAKVKRANRVIKLGTSPNRIIRVGHFRPDHRVRRADPSVRAARAAFGRPSSRRATKTGCTVRWRKLGLTIVFADPATVHTANPNGRRACRTGEAQEMTFSGRRARGWHTNRGVGIRTTVRKMKRRYRGARYMGVGTYSVVRQRLPFGNDPHFDLLQAFVTTQVRTPRVMTLKLLPLAAMYPPAVRD